MSTAVKAPFDHADHLFIGGDWVRPQTESHFDVIAPATEELYARVAEAGAADMDRAAAAARTAFDTGPWPWLSHRERADYLRALGREIAARAGALAEIWPNEMGVLFSVATAMSGGVKEIFDYYADLGESFAFEERHQPTAGGDIGLLTREPVGVAGIIVPWNGPIMAISYKIAPALLAGCTVVVKASPEAPGAAYLVAEAAKAAGFPAGVINVLTADREVSERLVRNPNIDKISFTGSTAAGRKIASICGDRIARYTLELGGKSSAVILDDYDVELAADAIVGPACWLSGQVCSSLTRIIVSRARHDALVEALAARFAKVRVGDPFDPASEMGPVAMRRQRDRIEDLIARGKAEGSRLAVGGGRPANLDRGFFIEPTIFGDVDNNSTLAREEIFGPVLSVVPIDDESKAIEYANDTIYGLNNSVFTNDADRAYQVARRLRSGTVGHNSFRTDFGIAFGGFKQSGVGREGGVEGLLPYLEAKTIILDAPPSHL